MAGEHDFARLNLLLEFLTDCAQVTNQEALLRAAGGRVRWVLPFERCVLALKQKGSMAFWTVTRDQEAMQAVNRSALPAPHAELIADALDRNVPVSAGRPPIMLCHPLHSGARSLGAICFSLEDSHYSFQDVRFAQYVANYLGSTVGRLEYDALEGENRAKDEFLARLSHELRNPLAPIITAVQLLKMKGQGEGRELDIIQRQSTHLIRLVDDLMDVARLARGKISLLRTLIQVDDAVKFALERCQLLFDERRQTVELNIAGTGDVINADMDRVQQVFVNLLSNASRYTGPGGKIVVSSYRKGGEVVVKVADNGVGITPDILSRIFDEFFQGDEMRGKSGLGIGLTIVKSLTELHGGSVCVESGGSGKGSTFTTRWPVADPLSKGPPYAAEHAERASTLASRAILVVDDNQDAADMLATLLRTNGHDVQTAYDGVTALQLVNQFQPDIAILDISLPDMDGYELAQHLRSSLRDAPPHLIALSGFGREIDKLRGQHAGFSTYLVKPVDAAVITACIGAIASKGHFLAEDGVAAAGESAKK